MRALRNLLPLAVMSFFFVGIIGFATAGDEHGDRDKAKLTGSVEPAVAATVNVIDANNGQQDLYRQDEMQEGQDEGQDQWGQDETQQEGFTGRDDSIVATAEVDPATGRFEVSGLEPGTYTVEIEPHDAGYERKEIEDVEIDQGEEKDLGAISLDDGDTFEDDDMEW
jgi:hypothetical protein